MRRFSDVFPTDPDAVPAYTFEADGGRTTWTLVDSHCDDPACLECASEAKLVPADPAQAAMEFAVNLDKGELSLPEGWTDLQKATCLDFLKSPPTRNVLLRRHQAVRADALRHVRRTRRAFDGALQCLTDFSPVQEPFLLPFHHLGEPWIAADLHCVAPGCPCANVQLSFSQPTRADRRLHEYCTILLDLDSGLRVDKGTTHLPAAPDDLVASFLASFPDWKLELLRRRRLVRAAAGRLLTFRSSPGAPPAAPPARAIETAGRNEPCACGSGKKFKKCCGK